MLPLNIDTYFFAEISLFTNLEYADEDEGVFAKLDTDQFELKFEHQFDNDSLHMQLSASTYEETENIKPYRFSFRIIGRFLLKDEMTDNDYKFSLNSASAVLYGALREKVHSLTSQMPYGPLIIPIQVITYEKAKEEQVPSPTVRHG